ncbi:cytochrome c3 family protein [Geotalea toluenoxydans]|uniref:cytochrome c3 family protein n=1 Tax=Geotalea toluenoxydans TaxID=421624 RepID=UPI0006CF8AB9|nr:cytochrome c3 family protein [Geotalea toluenoxydans]
MKKVLLTAAAVLTMAGSAMAASVVASKHDLSTGGPQTVYNTNTQQVCVFCHTPHNSKETRALWNRNSATSTSYKLYTSGVWAEQASWFESGQKGVIKSDSPSLMCMSCHDGSSLKAVVNKPKDVTALSASSDTIGTNPANLGTDLTNDHPINIKYQDYLDNTKYSGTTATLSAVEAGGVVGATAGLKLPLAKGITVECNTCHNVHDPANVPFLRGSMGKSALCTACHLK